jgi:hypothetical protein
MSSGHVWRWVALGAVALLLAERQALLRRTGVVRQCRQVSERVVCLYRRFAKAPIPPLVLLWEDATLRWRFYPLCGRPRRSVSAGPIL